MKYRIQIGHGVFCLYPVPWMDSVVFQLMGYKEPPQQQQCKSFILLAHAEKFHNSSLHTLESHFQGIFIDIDG